MSSSSSNPIYETYKPPGFHTIVPYIVTKDAPSLIKFLKSAFYAVELHRTTSEDDGIIRNCILQIGDACFMIGTAREEPVPTAQFCLYVDDPDTLYNRALEQGATSMMKVQDRSQGDRQGGVKDVSGTVWWITKRLKEKPYDDTDH